MTLETLRPMRNSPPDFCSKDGAEALKEKLESYWRERGHDVMVVLHEAGFTQVMRASRFDVRSDMKNGQPIKNNSCASR